MSDAFIQRSKTIWVGAEEVEVREMPLARVKRFKTVISNFAEEYNELMDTVRSTMEARDEALERGEDPETVNLELDMWSDIADMIFARPHEVLSVLVPNLPKEPFEDEENGVTIPQLIDAFDTVLEVNKIEWVKKSLPFIQSLILSSDLSFLTKR